MTAWVTDLMNGTPINEATVSISDKKEVTNQEGLCTIEKCKLTNVKRVREEEDENDGENEILVVEKGDDLCLVEDVHDSEAIDDFYVWHVFDDRGLYRPKEDVHIKGYVRLLKFDNEVRKPTYAQGVIDYIIYDFRKQKLEQSLTKLNDFGTFDIKFTLPDNINLGKTILFYAVL